MGITGRLQIAEQTLALRLTHMGVLVQQLLGLLAPTFNGMTEFQELPFRLAHQLDENFALASTLPAKAAHDLL